MGYLLLFPFLAKAQGYQYSNIDKKAKTLFEKAQEAILLEQFDKAIPLLEAAIRTDHQFLDAYAQLGSVYLQQKKYLPALQCFQQAFTIDSTAATPALLMYAKAEAGLGKFRQAFALTARYLKEDLKDPERQNAIKWKDHFAFAMRFLNKPIRFQPQNMGDSINSKDPEYFPSLTIDGKTLIFTRNLDYRQEDFFISHKDSLGRWSKAMNMGEPVNSEFNEGAQNISQDGKYLFFTGCNFPSSYGSCDLYYSVHTFYGWTRPRNVGAPVNTEFWDTQPCLSPDNKDLYFVSNRPGGYGGSDIYVSHLQAGGHWSQPENLGPVINTAGDENSPFIHADNQTLYFASNGHPGIGDLDIFVARRREDGTWNSPQNLGYPINTIDHEGSLLVAADGKTAYFASDRADSRGGLDLYTFELYPEVRPLQTLYVQGYVYDKRTGKRLPSAIDLIDLATGKLISQINADKNGEYLVPLPVGKDYAFNVSRKGYLFYSENFSLKDKNPNEPYLINIPLQPIEANASVVLKNIFFATKQYDLKPESRIELDKLVKLLQDNPTMRIEISGHTDNVGKPEDNLVLSNNRARAVVDYLTQKGIAIDRLIARGYGETRPIADNHTEEGRALNRRTELRVINL